ncbi:hypothetical protein HMPREF0462_0405 [Helicobacter pylori 83]|uniref:Uncharacterized protein n=1 Tax=Helicobacter pylori 83 TaxID=585538 RepID=F4D4T5_HELPX|nr:hypothetical protein HMPREF0462_0405 [Helicobacter pylori 83]
MALSISYCVPLIFILNCNQKRVKKLLKSFQKGQKLKRFQKKKKNNFSFLLARFD